MDNHSNRLSLALEVPLFSKNEDLRPRNPFAKTRRLEICHHRIQVREGRDSVEKPGSLTQAIQVESGAIEILAFNAFKLTRHASGDSMIPSPHLPDLLIF